jgi:signal transduction histidine kinase
VDVILPAEPCLVRGSSADLTEIVRILLDNAVRFSTEEPHISIRCELSADEVCLSVEDRGAGFEPELAEEILKPFTIADSLHHRSGSALNLAKANAIAIAHGGSIRAESEGQGRGAKFTLRLPRVQAENGNPAAKTAA